MYTNVCQKGNFIYVRGIEDGRRFKDKVDFRPTLWASSKNKDANDPWETLDGKLAYPIQPGNIWDCRKFVETYKDVEGINVYESPGNTYQYISENYLGELSFDSSEIKCTLIDIETEVENGFPNPDTASEEILLITLKDIGDDRIITWGRKPFDSASIATAKIAEENNVRIELIEYRCFENEGDLLKDFMAYWQNNYPDIVSGWNSTFFDMTYLYNRICNVVSKKFANKLSPWGHVSQKEAVGKFGQSATKTIINGIALLDYMDLYVKFGASSVKESYKLDAICEDEIKEKKVKNPGSTFKEFYDLHWDAFVVYNVRDVTLVEKLDMKKRLIVLAISMAYAAKINFEDVFSPVKSWDVIIYNYLNDKKMVIPRRTHNSKNEQFKGGYVKEPIPGKYKWCVSFDLTSLYPHIIMQNNMSPDTLVNFRVPVTLDGLLAKEVDLEPLLKDDLAMAGNGQCFMKDRQGLLPYHMDKFYNLRNTYKKEMLRLMGVKEETKDESLDNEISRLSALEQSTKIFLNSAFGAFGNPYFRYYDIRIAEGITKTGQLAIRWIADRLNIFMNKTLKTTGIDYVILIDTDSVVVNLEKLIDATYPDHTTNETVKYIDEISEKIFQPFITRTYEELATYTNAYAQKMFMKRENIVDVMLVVCKKQYVMNVHNSEGVQYKEPQLKIMGLQMVKSNTPAVVRKSLRESLQPILHGTEKDIQKYVGEFRDVYDKFTPEQIARPSGINGLDKYYDHRTIYTGGCPMHVRGALLYNHHLKRLGLEKKYQPIRDGDKIRYVYLRTPNTFRENVIAFVDEIPPEFELTEYVDYDMMFEKTFQAAVQKNIDPMHWSAETRANLEDFFT